MQRDLQSGVTLRKCNAKNHLDVAKSQQERYLTYDGTPIPSKLAGDFPDEIAVAS